MNKEIIGVVVKFNDLYICLPKPNRHSDVIYYAYYTLKLDLPIHQKLSNSGFYLNDGTFLNRLEALAYAKANSLLINQQAHTQLYSEDLW